MKRRYQKGIIMLVFLLAGMIFPIGVQAESADQQGIAVTRKNFPDRYFRTYVSEAIDKDKNGYVSEEERLSVKVIGSEFDADGKTSEELEKNNQFWISAWECRRINKPASFQGVEYFTELERLDVTKYLSELDLSYFPKLRMLSIWNTTLPTTLDLSKNPELERFQLVDTTGIKKINYGEKTKLKELTIMDMGYTKIDVSPFQALEELWISDVPIKKLDVSKNKNLTELLCKKTNVKTLDISRNKKLKKLSCEKNKLTKIKFPKTNCALKSLRCYRNQIKELDLSKCPKLVSLMCEKNKLTKLKLSKKVEDMGRFWCFKNKLKSIKVKKIDISSLKKDKATKIK